jgi:hypothetical protein
MMRGKGNTMKTHLTILAALGLLAFTAPADAGPRSYQAANCMVSLKVGDGSWKQINNDCFMGRDYDTDETAVKMGDAYLLISRDPDEYGIAKLYSVGKDGVRRFEGTALAKGACWVGRTIKFCAP